MLTGCLNNRWLVFVGDSEIRGIVLSLLKQLLRGTFENAADEVSLELNHASYFGYDKKEDFNVNKFNLALIDFLIETNTWTGEIVSVSRWSATKYSDTDYDFRNRLQDTSNKDYQFFGHTRTGTAYSELIKKSNPKTHFTRVSYMFTRWLHEALGEYLPLLSMPGRLEGTSTLIMNGGKWDMLGFLGSVPVPNRTHVSFSLIFSTIDDYFLTFDTHSQIFVFSAKIFFSHFVHTVLSALTAMWKNLI